jgi:putative protease
MKNKKVELLAPVGSFECLQAAVKAGADSFYFGVEQLNMRARSINAFTINDIKEIVSIARRNKVKAFLTLNTVMYEHDMQLLHTVLKEAKKRKVDAVIASDFAVIRMCNELGIPLHISTQANVCNLESVLFFAAFSDVIVLARELTLKQVQQLSKEISRRGIKGISGEPLRLEVFVHGALCMAVSGKCYLSLHQQNASANRGACLQNCRHSYKVIDTETNQELLVDNEYIMSAKDLCTIDILDQVVKSGVDVIKIEGRTKGPEYVYTTTRCYREALDALADGSYSSIKVGAWKRELGKVYNRGFWDGYYLGRKLGEWTEYPGSRATEKKVYIGKGTKYYPRIGVGEFIVEAGTIKKGDTLMVTGPAFGLIKNKMEKLVVNGEEASEAFKGDRITFEITEKITAKDKLYKIIETELV